MGPSDPSRDSLPDHLVDDVVAEAGALQDAAEASARRTASVQDVERAASELGIEPAYVQEALAARDVAAEHAALASRARQRSRRRALWFGGAILVAVVALGGLISVATQVGTAQVEARVDAAGRQLDEVLRRQADLVPMLIALHGARSADLDAAAEAVRDAETLDQRVAASASLHQALLDAIEALPPATNEAQAIQRMALQDELVGTWTRVQTEARRLREAQVR